MKKVITSLVVGVLIGSAGIGIASSGRNADIHYGGIWCKTQYSGGAPSVLCIREGGSGYGVGINRNLAMMMNLDSGKIVAARTQP